MQTGSSSKYVLAYDAYCGPCTKFKRIVDILDKYERIDFILLTKTDQEGLLDRSQNLLEILELKHGSVLQAGTYIAKDDYTNV